MQRSTNIRKPILAQINPFYDGSKSGDGAKERKECTLHSDESDGDWSSFKGTIAEIVARTKQRKRKRKVEKAATREGNSEARARKDRAAEFMISLEGSSEEEWEDDRESSWTSEPSSLSTEELGLSNLLLNSQVSLSYDSQVDPEYYIPDSHTESHSLSSIVHSCDPVISSSVVPCSLPDPTNTEVDVPKPPINDHITDRRPMSMRMSEEPRGKEAGVERNNSKSRGESVYTIEEVENMLRGLQLFKRKIIKGDRREAKVAKQDQHLEKVRVGREDRCLNEDHILECEGMWVASKEKGNPYYSK